MEWLKIPKNEFVKKTKKSLNRASKTSSSEDFFFLSGNNLSM